MKSLTTGVVLLIAGSFLLAGGCTAPEPVYTTAYGPGVAVGGEVEVNGPPPSPIEETIVASPGPGFTWVGGYWGWGAGGWRWEHGHWARPPHHGAVWVAPRYANRGGRHVWVHGGWR